MAIPDVFKDVRVNVRVDGVPLPEYQDATIEEEENARTRFIECESAQQFTIYYDVKLSATLRNAIRFRVYVDGEYTASRIIRRHEGHSGEILGVQVSPTQVKPYRFASLQTGDSSPERSLFID